MKVLTRRRARLVVAAGLFLVLLAAVHFARSGDVSRNESGFVKKTYTNAAGESFRYLVFIPFQRVPGRKLQVILFLNGVGENGDDGLLQISNNFGWDVWRMRGHFPFLAVFPQCAYDDHWTPGTPSAQRALAILEEAIAEYGGDPDRVYVTGVSAGGKAVWEFAAAYPDRFAAAVPVSVGRGGDAANIAAGNLPIWSFINARDRAELVASAREMRRELLKHGVSPLLTEFDRRLHNAWDSAYGPPGLYGWLLEQNRSRNVRGGKFELLAPKQVLATWKRQGSGVWDLADDDLVARIPSDGTDARLLAPHPVDDAEWHFDIFLGAHDRGRIALVSADGEKLRAEIVLELSDAGSGGIRGADGNWLAPLDPVGQRALRPGWNDVRLARQAGAITLRLNGWPALEVEGPFDGESILWGLRVAAGDTPVRWRFLRQRDLRRAGDREAAP